MNGRLEKLGALVKQGDSVKIRGLECLDELSELLLGALL